MNLKINKIVRKGFTLVEMLVVIGIIAALTGVSIASYSRLVRSAEKTRARELVSNVATAMAALYEREGMWPRKLLAGASGNNRLNDSAALPLGKKGVFSLQMNSAQTALMGLDRFGVVTPWAADTIKHVGTGASLATRVGSSQKTVEDHILRFALDLDGDGITELPQIDGMSGSGKVRAVACVWCCSRDGSLKYRDIIKSWTEGQVVK